MPSAGERKRQEFRTTGASLRSPSAMLWRFPCAHFVRVELRALIMASFSETIKKAT